MGGDQYMWVKIARRYPVCYSPNDYSITVWLPPTARRPFIRRRRLVFVSRLLRSAGGFLSERILGPLELGKAQTLSAKGGTQEGRSAERFYRYTRCNRRAWYKLWVLNRIPMPLRAWVFRQYNRLA